MMREWIPSAVHQFCQNMIWCGRNDPGAFLSLGGGADQIAPAKTAVKKSGLESSQRAQKTLDSFFKTKGTPQKVPKPVTVLELSEDSPYSKLLLVHFFFGFLPHRTSNWKRHRQSTWTTFQYEHVFRSRCATVTVPHRGIPHPSSKVSEEDVMWWREAICGNERAVRAINGFSSEICAEIYAM